ncbi:hypothetical protein [Virgibacillus sp. YIM 98842]|uniref:hypothetical protein n=1 Tax=Virgibacillus sp. YIM 98842 TaxID=2663533 RepID=UPI0013DD2775|nr:hypothetical protein [Virgibacillus sp. YIM 98842]
MGDLEPVTEIKSHEFGIVAEGVADSKVTAEELTLFATRKILYARLAQVKGTAGTAAYLIGDVIYAGSTYEWTMNHVVPVEDALELFDVRVEEVNHKSECVIDGRVNSNSEKNIKRFGKNDSFQECWNR